jgi:hypothetical protein
MSPCPPSPALVSLVPVSFVSEGISLALASYYRHVNIKIRLVQH